MRQEDPDGYRNHLRMLPEKFDELLGKIGDKITKNDTHMRNAIPATTKLEITLRFLATGDSFVSLEALYRVGKSTISQFIPVVCSEIATALKEFIKIPTRQEWKEIENGFRTKWNFPGCIGAIDGKHINIIAPDDTSNYFNYKGSHSIVLLALVDDDYCFSYIDIGCNGRASDGGVFERSGLKQGLENNSLDIPEFILL
ncbi:Protein ANTAGONIST OF LIKE HETEROCHROMATIN PROTEIN 1 [Eumeta japonica]|uniref:Protein ANTAGONIST OF LIKE HETEROCHROMATIN PROTEIN 1 n=1 Tax=Eumeta variegata TaxID=151549 RepID=A0A4C1Y2C1_EUMVA|nr:Protein ANTAGONIST OF LIKE HETEROCHROMATIN PROTEIN 1 [Eumeta japonica]